jgi:DNA modification methylase
MNEDGFTDLNIINADVIDGLGRIPGQSVQCIVTSPPYWGLRDYGVEGQIGLERTPEEYVATMVKVFSEARRVLRDDGVLWLNLGDSYSQGGYAGDDAPSNARRIASGCADGSFHGAGREAIRQGHRKPMQRKAKDIGLKPKDLVGIPWRVAFALQADGWYLRSDVIWAKPNPMPESVTDRPTKAHEYVFLMTKAARYYYEADAVKERGTGRPLFDNNGSRAVVDSSRHDHGRHNASPADTRNARTVWAIPSEPYPEAHFATFPTALAERCIRAGSRPGDTVLDPFAGSGTTLAVARGLGRSAIGIEINPEYVKLIEKRCALPWERTIHDKGAIQSDLFSDGKASDE